MLIPVLVMFPQKFTSKAPSCVITSNVCTLSGNTPSHLWFPDKSFVRLHMFIVLVSGLYMIAAWRSLSTTKQRQSACWGCRRVSAVCKTSNFAHNSDVWFNTLPKYLKPNKQCLTENQQTKQRRLRAFALDQKLKSEKSVWILIKRLIVEIAFRKKLSVFTFCTGYLPQSIFMLI